MEYNATYRQKDNGWQVIISYKDHNNRWKQKSKQGFPTKSKAKASGEVIIEQLKEQAKLNKPVELLDFTFKEYATLILYHKTLKNFKALNALKVTDINHMHIESCVFEMSNTLSPVTQHARLQCIKAMFNRAIEEYCPITKNPVAKVKLKTTKQNDKKTILTSSELDDFLKQVRSFTFDH